MRDCSSASRTLASTGCHSRARRSSQAQAAPASAAPASGTPSRRRPWPASASPAHHSGHQAISAEAAPSASRLPRRAAAVRRASADFSAHTVTSHSSVPAMPTYMAPDWRTSQSPGLLALTSTPSASTACTPSTTRSASIGAADVERHGGPLAGAGLLVEQRVEVGGREGARIQIGRPRAGRPHADRPRVGAAQVGVRRIVRRRRSAGRRRPGPQRGVGELGAARRLPDRRT